MNLYITAVTALVSLAIGASLGASYTGSKWEAKYAARENALLVAQKEAQDAAAYVTKKYEQHARETDKWAANQTRISHEKESLLHRATDELGRMLGKPCPGSMPEAGASASAGQPTNSAAEQADIQRRANGIAQFLGQQAIKGDAVAIYAWACYHAINGTPLGDLK